MAPISAPAAWWTGTIAMARNGYTHPTYELAGD